MFSFTQALQIVGWDLTVQGEANTIYLYLIIQAGHSHNMNV